MVIKAVITTLDNLPILKEQVAILRNDPLIDEIIVVNNGSVDGTQEWLESEIGLTVVNKENNGAGPGRNAGVDAAGEFDYVLMVDGGIRPLIGGVKYMLEYLEAHPEVDVISPEIATCFTTDVERAHRRMVKPIDESTCFSQRMLSSTAYCLCRYSAWDGIRFCEDGPYAEPGWGVDDNYHAFEWNERGILHHDFSGVLLYRRASGSFGRLAKETGIWPNQYGSVYEKRLVKCWQDFPHQWNQFNKFPLEISVVVVGWNEYPMFVRAIQVIHDELKDIPHEVIFVDNGSTDRTEWWLDTFALRQHHGNTTIDAETGVVIRRKDDDVWTGNVIRVDMSENRGAGEAFNAGFDRAHKNSRHIFYLAGDIIPTYGSIKAMYQYLEEHEDVAYVCLNAWTCQEEVEQPEWDGVLPAAQGLGNYAYSYALVRKEVIDNGCRMADTGPFAGAGCGFEEVEMAYQMYSKGYRAFTFNGPAYYHHRRDFERSGFDTKEEIAQAKLATKLTERRQWLATRWKPCNFAIIHYHDQPPERHIKHVGIVYKAIDARPGPGGFLVRALDGICEVDQYEPGAEPEGLDAYVYVDNGDYDYFLCPEHAHPSFFWAIDMMTPQQGWRPLLDKYVERGRTFDHVYAAQPSAVDYFIQNGVNATWLPLAADPNYHDPRGGYRDLSWVAAWHNCGERIEYSAAAAAHFDNGRVCYADGDTYAREISRGKCALNLSRSDELNMRVFEVMAIGTPLVCDRARGMDKLFEEGRHYLGFNGVDEMVAQIEYVNDFPELAMQMAEKARSLVLDRHTYYHRALTMLGRY